jgi:Protein of unknown function (DUF4241)
MNYALFFQNHDVPRRTIDRYEIGILALPSGKIVACDPVYNPEKEPFVQTVTPGKYPVLLYVDTNENAVGLVKIKFSDAPALRWEMALIPEQNLGVLADDEYFGYEVTSGLGCFMDSETGNILQYVQQEVSKQLGDDYIDYHDNVLIDELAAKADIYCNHLPTPDSDLNVMIFSTGWQEGIFPSYWGYDVEGKVVALLTDFNLFENEQV